MQRYEKYKDSGVDWIGEIPEGWFQEPFSSVFSLKSVINNKNEELLSVYLDKGVIRFSDVGEKRTNVTSEDLSKYQLVEEGDFVLNNQQAWRGSVGVSFYRGIVSPAYIVLAIKNNFDFRFLNYLLRNRSFVTHYLLCSKGVGTIQRNLYWPQLKRVYLIFPSLEEQQTIATFLYDKTAKIDQTIAIKEKEIELLKERRQILIQKAVTKGLDDTVKLKDSGVDWIGEIPEHWEVRKLKQVCKININSLDERTNPNYEFEYIDIGSVTYENGIINRESFLFKNAPSRARRIAKEGDTIVSTVRTYLKAIDFVDKSKSNYIFSTGFAVLEPNNDVYPKYLFSFIKSDAFTEQVSVNSKGMSYPAINSTELGAQKVLFIPYEEQIHIVSYLEVIEEKIAKAITLKEQEIEKLKEYKTVLIDQVVTGKVRVNKINYKISVKN